MSRMYGEKAIELIRDLKRFDTLPPYNEAVVREAIKEINALFAENYRTLTEDPEAAASAEGMFGIQLNHASIMRNKRIIMAYLNHRLKKLQALRWDRASSVLPPDVIENVSEEERNFWLRYDKNVAAYMKHFPSLDLASDITHPPKESKIQVRVLKNWPSIMIETGEVIKLQRYTVLYLPRSAVEPLIKQGVLEHCV